MNHLFLRRALAPAALIVLFALPACRPSGPSITVGGKKLDEAYLKEKMPDQYQEIRSQYEEQILGALKNAASKRLFELEAESQKMKPEEYSRKLSGAVTAPTEGEIAAKYAELKAQGQIGKESLPELRDRIAFFLRQERQRAVFSEEFARLRTKYGYEVNQVRKLAKIDVEGEPATKADQAKVTVVEFTDFRCGYCRRVRGTADELHKKYGNKLRWVIKDSPFQPGSMEMHRAANCVYKQNPDLYWKYFSLMFEESRAADITTEAGLERRAVKMGADSGKFRACIQDPAMTAEIQKDLEEGRSVGVNGTPAFFINGRMLSGAQPLEEFVAVIDEELQKK